MKTTLDLPDELLRRAKRAALERGISLKAIVTEALTRELGPAERCAPLATHVWPPPERGGDTVDPDVVLRAIRALRDGDPIVTDARSSNEKGPRRGGSSDASS